MSSYQRSVMLEQIRGSISKCPEDKELWAHIADTLLESGWTWRKEEIETLRQNNAKAGEACEEWKTRAKTTRAATILEAAEIIVKNTEAHSTGSGTFDLVPRRPGVLTGMSYSAAILDLLKTEKKT